MGVGNLSFSDRLSPPLMVKIAPFSSLVRKTTCIVYPLALPLVLSTAVTCAFCLSSLRDAKSNQSERNGALHPHG